MANEEHLNILKQGVEVWNEWRKDNSDLTPDLRGVSLNKANLVRINLKGANLNGAQLVGARLFRANLRVTDFRKANLCQANLNRVDLREADLSGADLSGAHLSEARLSRAILGNAILRDTYLSGADIRGVILIGADLSGANLRRANLSGANLSGAILNGARLIEADLSGANLRRANLSGADLGDADLSYADLADANLYGAILSQANLRRSNLHNTNLTGAILNGASLVETDLSYTILSGCSIHGISAWGVKLDGARQSDLIITDYGEPVITVDNLEIAQFVYMLLHNEKIRDVIDTIGKKAVLILGRFTPERKAVLDALRVELRKHNYIPILFDFEKPASRDLTETVVTLAHLSRFVIADLTDPSSVPHELMSFVRDLPSVAVQPIVNTGNRAYAMFEHLARYPWVLPLHEYDTQEGLIAALAEQIIQPAEAKVREIRPK